MGFNLFDRKSRKPSGSKRPAAARAVAATREGAVRRAAAATLEKLEDRCLLSTVYDSAGFESPRFTAGSLTGQDGGTWLEAGSGGTATVQSAVTFQGNQAVQVARTTGDKRYWANVPIVTPTTTVGSSGRYVLVDWDMNVSQSTGHPFGPFFGMEAYDPNTKVIAGVGVDAATGEVLYEDPSSSGDLTPTDADFTVPFGTWHHYEIAMDYATHQSLLIVDGVLRQTIHGFVDETAPGQITQFSDADISALAAAAEPPAQAGNAYFDNYKVTTAAQPAADRFDFGTATSPVASGYTQVTSATTYTAAQGYGWQSGSIGDDNVNIGGALFQDFNYINAGSTGVFAVDVPNGRYDVTVYLGDERSSSPRDNMGVFLEGNQVDSVSTAGGQVVTKTYTVTVTDGQLNLGLHDLGGDPYTVIEGLEVAANTTGPKIVSATPTGTVSGSQSKVRLVFDQPILDGTFTLADVDSLTGPGGAISPTAVSKVDSQTYDVTFPAQSTNGTYTLVVGPNITNASGTPMDQNGDGTAGQDPGDRYTTTFTIGAVPPFSAKYDFGTASSPVAAGYTQVTSATTYSAAQGYGWQSGSIGDDNVNIGSPLFQDFNYINAGSTGVFAVNLPNGVYNVTVYLGDERSNAPRDQMGVFLEGSQVDSVNTAGGQVVAKTYMVTVSDGQLNVGFHDLGGDPYTVIEGLEVANATGPKIVSATPTGTVSGSQSKVRLVFDQPILDGTFTLADVDSLTGPGGAISPTAVSKVDSQTYDVTFPAQSTNGTYTLVVGPNITNASGTPMDQNGDGTAGQDPGDRYTTTFTIGAVPPFSAKYDFGTASSPVAAGYTQVTSATTYSAAQGYGWQSGSIGDDDTGIDGTLFRDFNYINAGSTGVFAVNLPNGVYNVTVYLGDLRSNSPRDNMGVFLEGNQVDSVSTVGGQVVTKVYTVTVSDGQLNVGFHDLGGDPYTVIEGLEVAANTAGPKIVSATPSGAVSGSQNKVRLVFDQPILDGTFTLADVDSLTGPSGAISPTAVSKVDSQTYDVTFPAQSTNGTYTLVVGPNITNAAGTPMDQNGDGTAGQDPGDRYTTSFTIGVAAPFSAKYDFGTAISPVAAGYTQVTSTTTYSGAQGYGWQSGSIGDDNVNIGGPLFQDFNYINTGSTGVFAVDLANGTYDVTVYLGDERSNMPHDNMGVFLEGSQVDSVNTAGGQVVTKTYTVTVSDGQLNVGFHDLGGDPYTVIEGLEVATHTPPTTFTGYDSAGFEPARFTTGNLTGQDSGVWSWIESGATGVGGTATVENAITFQGSQAVQVTRTTADKRYWANFPDFTPTSTVGSASRYILVDWDMNVTQNTGTTFGPFFGMEAYDPNTKVIAGVGVDAATGELLYEDPNNAVRGALTPTASDFKVAFGTWHHYELALDYAKHQSLVFVDGALQAVINGFVDETSPGQITKFSDADISALAAAAGPNETGTAYFDNYKITPAASVPSEHFDFGTAGSPVAAGYTQVTAATTYAATRGFGWLSGSIGDDNVNIGGALFQDFNYINPGSTGVFAVDLANGTYDVTVYLGDERSNMPRDNMGVFLEGNQVDNVTTAGGQVVAKTYTVTVSDGQLDLGLRDLGGDPYTVIEGLDVVPH